MAGEGSGAGKVSKDRRVGGKKKQIGGKEGGQRYRRRLEASREKEEKALFPSDEQRVVSQPTLEDYTKLWQEYATFAEHCSSDPLAYACEVAFVVFLRDYEGLRLFLAIARAIESETSVAEER